MRSAFLIPSLDITSGDVQRDTTNSLQPCILRHFLTIRVDFYATGGFTCDTRYPLSASSAKLRLQVAHGVSELREDDDLVIRMILSEQFMECSE
ncbi:MAG: hypothetical protein LC776_09975, partial [Acidobacteria bacterium]|nr:hypothetical protein [Acidobacteriota bacterium]